MAQCRRKDACLKEMQSLIERQQAEQNKDQYYMKMLRLRAKVVRQKRLVINELKMTVAKAKCVFAIWERAQSRQNHSYVIQELKQRTNLARCVQKIKTRDFYPRHVAWPVEISPLVAVKQHIKHKKVMKVIEQFGRSLQRQNDKKAEVARYHKMVMSEFKRRWRHAEAIQYQKNLKKAEVARYHKMAMRELKRRFRHAEAMQNEIVKKAEVARYHKMVMTEYKQRWRHAEVMQEIRTRQKQIFWKQQTCIIIKQGGHKVRVNKEIRSIARQKCIKRQVINLIKQGGIRSRLMKEIRQLRMISELKKQKDLKAKVNLAIRQMAEAADNKRKICTVIKQTGLKARCSREIRKQRYRLRSCPAPKLMQRRIIVERSQQPKQQLTSIVQVAAQRETLEHHQLTRPKINANKRRRRGELMQHQLQKLADKLEEHNEKQEGRIRSLTAEVQQQKADFNALVSRMVDDKNKLYQELDVLMRENQILKDNLRMQEEESSKLMIQKPKAQVVGKAHGSNRHRQIQQSSIFYQEMQELGKSKVSNNIVRGKIGNKHQLNRQVQQVDNMTQILL